MTKPALNQLAIPFNRPNLTGREIDYIQRALASNKIGPGGEFVDKCKQWLTSHFQVPYAAPTGSCTAALEIAAILLDLKPGNEIILPSFGYVSTANAFARAGAELVFVDIDPLTMNIDPNAVEAAVTSRTRAIALIHYAGVSCDMDRILAIARDHELAVVEDAALAFLSKYKNRNCGTIGDLSCFSFHETKTVHCGQGGALLVNRADFIPRAEIILEKGTDRGRFLRNEVGKYTWRDLGSAYVLENLRAAFLFAQFEQGDAVTAERVDQWRHYQALFEPLRDRGRIELPNVPEYAEINGHIYWIKAKDETERDDLIAHLRTHGVHAIFHYVPLHSSEAGMKYGRFHGDDRYTTREASRLLRLPLFHELDGIETVVDCVAEFFETR